MGIVATIKRAFAPAEVPALGRSALGVDGETFGPPEYGDYLATSNGVYVCARIRSQLLASLPVRAYRLTADGREAVETGPLVDLLRKVNPYWTFTRLVETTQMSLCAWGSAYWLLERGRGGAPTEIWWVRPDRVRVVPSGKGYVARFEYLPPGAAEPIRYAPEEVVWLRYPNPLEEYSGLSPLAAARIAADTGSAAMKSNRNLFLNGVNAGGIVTPNGGSDLLSEGQAQELADLFRRRMKGVDNAHRWMVLRYDAKFTPMSMTPKDAEYLGSMRWNLEEIARAYGVPLDLIGGQRTYENVDAAMKAIWVNTVLPEARLLASELTEQLLPMFPGQADEIAFDESEVDVLQADRQIAWAVAQGQIQTGAITINEWRAEEGMDPLAWGDERWAPPGLAGGPAGGEPDGDEPPAGEPPADEPAAGDQPPDDGASRSAARVEFGSAEHEAIIARVLASLDPHEERMRRAVRSLLRRQEQSVLTALGKRRRDAADPEDVERLMAEILDLPAWRRRFREAIRPDLSHIAEAAGEEAVASVTVGVAFDVLDPAVVRALERQAQRFAREVNATTWERLKASLAEGLAAGEGTDGLAVRVREVMGGRIASDAETIARTETAPAYTTGNLEGWRQSGVVQGKQWLAALDERTRATHLAAHGQTVGLDEDFAVGDGSGQGPGLIGLPEEDINCLPGNALVYAEEVEAATMRWYEGDLVRLTLASGRVISSTPNHPMLTEQGWVAAGRLGKGDDLVGYRLAEHVAVADPDPHHEPAEIAEVFRLLSQAGAAHRVVGREPQFHGDGRGGEVDVVRAGGELGRGRQAARGQPAAQEVFTAAEVLARDLTGDGAEREFVGAAPLAAHGVVGGGGKSLPFVRAGLGHAEEHGVAAPARFDARLKEDAANRGPADAELGGERLFRRAGEVASDEVVNVERVEFRGHVYNLQTRTGHYWCNVIVTHNCRCAAIPVVGAIA